MRLRKRAGEPEATIVDDGPPPAPKHWKVDVVFGIEGLTVVSDDDNCVTLDVSGLPSGVTSVRLSIGNLFATIPFDVDGHRVRHPEQPLVRFRAPRP